MSDKGIRGLIAPGVVLPEEENEMRKARAEVMKKINAGTDLQAAIKPKLDAEELAYFSQPILRTPIIEKLPVEVKDEYGFTKLQNKEIEEYLTRPAVNSKGAWKEFVESNKKAEKETPKQTWDRLDQNEKRRQQQVLKNWGLDKDPSISKLPILKNNINNKKENVYQPKKNFVKKVDIHIDPKHPDGFTLNEDEDLYKYYGKEPLRYVQEIAYKYDGKPVTEVVKEFDNQDKSTYPSNFTPSQKNHLKMYQQVYDDLTPLQRKQVDAARAKRKK